MARSSSSAPPTPPAASTRRSPASTAGKPDTTFGDEGWRTAEEKGYFYAGAVTADERSAAGDTWQGDDASFYRFTTAGLPDKSFSENGWIGFDLGDDDAAHALALQPDGKIVIAGDTEAGGDAVVWRANSDGTRTRLRRERRPSRARHRPQDAVEVAVAPDGKIVLAGTKAGTSGDALAYRLLGDSRAGSRAVRRQRPGRLAGGCALRGQARNHRRTARRDVLRGTRGAT